MSVCGGGGHEDPLNVTYLLTGFRANRLGLGRDGSTLKHYASSLVLREKLPWFKLTEAVY